MQDTVQASTADDARKSTVRDSIQYVRIRVRVHVPMRVIIDNSPPLALLSDLDVNFDKLTEI